MREETDVLVSSLDNDVLKLEQQNKASKEIKQKMVELRCQLGRLENEIHVGKVLREEMSAELDKEREDRERDRRVISGLLYSD